MTSTANFLEILSSKVDFDLDMKNFGPMGVSKKLQLFY